MYKSVKVCNTVFSWLSRVHLKSRIVVHDVVDPLKVVENCGVDHVLLPDTTTNTEAGDALDAVGHSGSALEGAHEAAPAVTRASVGFAGRPSGAEHVGGDEEVAV